MTRNAAAVAATGLQPMVCALPANVLMLSGYWPVVGTSIAVAAADGRVGPVVPKDEVALAEAGWAEHLVAFQPGSQLQTSHRPRRRICRHRP